MREYAEAIIIAVMLVCDVVLAWTALVEGVDIAVVALAMVVATAALLCAVAWISGRRK